MSDPDVRIVREWLQRQPSLRILSLFLFIEQAIKDAHGEEVMNSLDRDLNEAYR